MDAEAIAAEGTPVFVYRPAQVRQRAEQLRQALEGTAHIHLALKANHHGPLVAAVRPALDGADVTSEGELRAALDAGFEPRAISLSGPAHAPELLRRAADRGHTLSLNSVDDAVPGARALLRVNPSERLQAFRSATGGVPSPFGVPEEDLDAALAILTEKNASPIGLHVHRGSQCTSAAALTRHVVSTLDLAHRAAERGLALEEVNFGGGLGVARGDMPSLDIDSFGRRAASALRRFGQAWPGVTFVIEPGRWLLAEAGVLLLRVRRRLESRGEVFVVLDGGLDCFLFATDRERDGAPYPLRNLSREGPTEAVSVVGPACTSRDSLGRHRLPRCEVGDLIAVEQAGAYALGASPHGFLGRAAPRAVLLD